MGLSLTAQLLDSPTEGSFWRWGLRCHWQFKNGYLGRRKGRYLWWCRGGGGVTSDDEADVFGKPQKPHPSFAKLTSPNFTCPISSQRIAAHEQLYPLPEANVWQNFNWRSWLRWLFSVWYKKHGKTDRKIFVVLLSPSLASWLAPWLVSLLISFLASLLASPSCPLDVTMFLMWLFPWCCSPGRWPHGWPHCWPRLIVSLM